LSRAAKRRNKQSIPTEVRVTSIIKPYRADPIISFSIRYIATGSNTAINAARLVTRAFVLNTLIVNLVSTTSNSRLLQAVKINKLTLYTSNVASVEWLSSYGPSSAILVTGTSTVSPGILVSRPPQKTLAGAWSFNGSNESENVLSLTYTSGDILDVSFSAVLCDRASGSSVVTASSGSNGFIYRTFFDGPSGSAQMQPLALSFLN
jgi:hypothetical protein